MSDVPDLSAIVKAYDVRGRAGEQLSEEICEALGAAFADFLDAGAIIVAHDMRVSSPQLSDAFVRGAVRRGSTVAVAGLSSTDQLYCASGLHRAAGAMFTASHNPAPDNGIKMCLPGAKPISRDSGLDEIRRTAEQYLAAGEIPVRDGGRAEQIDTLADYVDMLVQLVPVPPRRRVRVVVDAANAMAGHTMPAVAERLDGVEIIPLHFDLDGTFPNHDANPLDASTLRELQDAVRAHGADLGLAFDGDADRCVAVDEKGRVISPSAVTALIAQREIARARSAGEENPAVVANLVSSLHVQEAIEAAGGRRIRSRVGHSLIKALMAQENAVFGGEHSAHYYFRDFFFADSGMLAALHLLAALAETDARVSELIEEHDPYAASGEINSRVADVPAAVARARGAAEQMGPAQFDELDGLTATCWDESDPDGDRWWFSLRASNTEPLLRLNVEAAEEPVMERVRDRILAVIRDDDTDDHVTVEATAGADVPAWVREILRCPVTGEPLEDTPEGLLSPSTGHVYQVVDGIPILLPPREHGRA